jgi:hypothetical protein
LQERRGIVRNNKKNIGTKYDDDQDDMIKRRPKQPENSFNDDTLTPQELTALQQRKQRLRKFREEREKKRRQQQQTRKSTNHSRLKQKKRRLNTKHRRRESDDDSDHEEFELTLGSDDKNDYSASISKEQDNCQTNVGVNDDDDDDDDDDEEPDKRQQTNGDEVVCPLCQQIVPIPTPTQGTAIDQLEVDAMLAKHMNSCQTTMQPSRTRRNQQKTSMTVSSNKTRKRVRTINRPEVVDDQDDIDLEADDYETEEDRDEVAASSEDIDDSDGVLEVDDESNDDEITLGAKRKKPSAVRLSYSREAVDDWEEYDYEDRVADWTEQGLINMKSMKERDADETPPGQHIYEGGLVVPAWVNDRLFPYQRTGLQWMWELHRQQCGGILGDEMGLVSMVEKTVMIYLSIRHF